MGFLDRRPTTMTDDELREALFNAAARPGSPELQDLLMKQMARVITLFPGWTTLPPAVRSNAGRLKWWGEGLIRVAAAAAELGEPSLMARLHGRPENNILMLWQNAVLESQADAVRGEYSSAITRLEHMLHQVDEISGPGVDHLLPKTYGLLGTLYFHAGDRERARTITVEARDYCRRIGDREGVETYTRNLSVMDGC